MQRLLLPAVIWLLSASIVVAQEQEKKLLDRLLRPDMSLQNPAQAKLFRAGKINTTRQVQTAAFYVTDRPAEKAFTQTRQYHTPTFDLSRHHFDTAQAKLTTRTLIAKTEAPYPTSNYRVVNKALATEKTVETSEFAESSRPFLVRGKSQQSLSAQDHPLTIDQVRELLNKSK